MRIGKSMIGTIRSSATPWIHGGLDAHAVVHGRRRSTEEVFMVGPQLHMPEGAARVMPLRMKIDMASGHQEGGFRWDGSWEAHTHRLAYGVVDKPACWILLVYASGYPTAKPCATVFDAICCKSFSATPGST